MAGIKVQLTVDDKGTVKVKQFGKTLGQAAQKGKAGFKDVNLALDGLKRNLAPTAGLVTKIGAAFATWQLAGVAVDFLDTAASMETYQITLGTVLKSTERAGEMMEWIRDFAATTPFEIPGLVEAATRLEAYGLDAQKYMRTLGDTAAGMGKPIMAAVEMIADASQGEFERMKEFGLRSTDVAKAAGFATVSEMTSTRENLIHGTETLMSMLEDRYAGGMEELSKSWTGMVSNASDIWTQYQEAVMGGGVFDFLKAGLSMVLEHLNKLKKEGRLDEWAKDMAQKVITGLEWIIKGAALVADAFRGWQMIWEGLKLAFSVFASAVTKGFQKILEVSLKAAQAVGADDAAFSIAKSLQRVRAANEFWNDSIDSSVTKLEELAGQESVYSQASDLIGKMKDRAAGYADTLDKKVIPKTKDMAETTKLTAKEAKKLAEAMDTIGKWDQSTQEGWAVTQRRGGAVPVSEEYWLKDIWGVDGEADKTITTFLGRTEGAFTDTFVGIFEGTVQDFGDALDIMDSLFSGMLREMASDFMRSKVFKLQQTSGEAIDSSQVGGLSSLGNSGTLGIVSAVVTSAVKFIGHVMDKSEHRKAKTEAYLRALEETNKAIDALEGNYTELDKTLEDVSAVYEKKIRLMEELNFSIYAVNEAEAARIEMLEKVRQEYIAEFQRPIKDIIASFQLTEFEQGRIQLDYWFDGLIDKARELGEESVKLLREAYELSKMQAYVEQVGLLNQLTDDFVEIVQTLNMTPIERALYQLEKEHAAMAETWGETETQIANITDDILGLNEELVDLHATLRDLRAEASQTSIAQASQWDALVAIVQKAAGFPDELAGSLTYTSQTWLEALKQGVAGLGAEGYLETAIAESGFYDTKTFFASLMQRLYGDFRLPTFEFGVDQIETTMEAFDRYKILTDRLKDLNAQVAEFAAALPGEVEAINDAINALEDEREELISGLTEAQQAELAAYQAQVDALTAQVQTDINKIIQQHTLTDQELKQLALDEWYDEQLAIHIALGMSIDGLNYAYELQEQAIWDTAAAAGELTTALDSTLKSINAMIEELTGGSLAPVQSAEFYTGKYSTLLAAAQGGTDAAVQELLGFIPTFLDFMTGYGPDYGALTSSIVSDLEALKLTLPGMATGGLTAGLTFAGEGGPEWVVPTYEPERSRFLSDVGMDPDRIGAAIARHLIPVLTENNDGKEIHLHVNVDGQPVRDTVIRGLDGRDHELIAATRRAVN